MKIDFENEFYDYILSRGYEYYLRDKVSNVTINDNIVTAVVKGTDDYKVELELENDTFIGGECSCPYFDTGDNCKHIAAVLYYLNGNEIKNTSNNYNLADIVNKVNEKNIRKFLYNNLVNDSDLLNRFRVEFSGYFPKLSKENYRNKIYNAIARCYDRHGFIDYSNTSSYEHAMYEFINEAQKLVDNGDYETAFTIVTIILDSIPNTDIDDSNGSTGMVAEDCIEIFFDILDEVHDKNSAILKSILYYVINEVKTANLYNYGIDLNQILKSFIDDKLYLDDIKISLEIALDKSKDKAYFYSREDYVEYLIQIYELKGKNNKKIELLEKYSYDSKVCMKYIDELIKIGKINDAIKVLKDKLDEKDYKSISYADKLAQIYLDKNMMDEYKDILYDLFYKFDKYDIDVYLKIKNLYSNKDWGTEKNKIINNVKKEKFNDRALNKIYIEEKMYDELFFNIYNYSMDYIKEYEQYLLPKYNNELLDIYKKSCLVEAEHANNRSSYRKVAIKINHITKIDNSNKVVDSILKKISKKHFRNRPAMVDEFKSVIKNLDKYIN